MSTWPTAAVGTERGILVPGLENVLPPGEEPLWVGAPHAAAVARYALHVRKLALYFAVLLGLRGVMLLDTSAPLVSLIDGLTWLLLLGVATVLFASGLSVLVARTSVYVVTPRRVVMRIGVAIPVTINIPLRQIEAVSLRVARDGTGDVAFTLGSNVRIAYLLLWPHARPWNLRAPQPSFRAIANASAVGALVARAVAGETAERTVTTPATAPVVDGLTPRAGVRELAEVAAR